VYGRDLPSAADESYITRSLEWRKTPVKVLDKGQYVIEAKFSTRRMIDGSNVAKMGNFKMSKRMRVHSRELLRNLTVARIVSKMRLGCIPSILV